MNALRDDTCPLGPYLPSNYNRKTSNLMSSAKLSLVVLGSLWSVHCLGQQPQVGRLPVPRFNWQLEIPAFLVAENKDEWRKVQDAGKDAISDTYDIALENKLRTIFIFKSKDNSFFEAVSEPISKAEAADYAQTCERMNNIFYNFLKAKLPEAHVDTTKGVQFVGKLPFQVLMARLTFPDGLKKTTITYRRVFDNQELTVSIMYENQASGDEIIRAFKSSTFGKK